MFISVNLFTTDILAALLFCTLGILFFGGFLHTLLWQTIVDVQGITIKNAIGKIRTYSIQDISKVNIKKSGEAYYVLIYVDKKRIAKINSSVNHTDWLLERLFKEQVPVYKNGKLITDSLLYT